MCAVYPGGPAVSIFAVGLSVAATRRPHNHLILQAVGYSVRRVTTTLALGSDTAAPVWCACSACAVQAWGLCALAGASAAPATDRTRAHCSHSLAAKSAP